MHKNHIPRVLRIGASKEVVDKRIQDFQETLYCTAAAPDYLAARI